MKVGGMIGPRYITTDDGDNCGLARALERLFLGYISNPILVNLKYCPEEAIALFGSDRYSPRVSKQTSLTSTLHLTSSS